MVVSGVIVETLPGKAEVVKNCLDIMDDVAIYREIDECRLAVIIKSDKILNEGTISGKLENIEGVLNAEESSHYFRLDPEKKAPCVN